MANAKRKRLAAWIMLLVLMGGFAALRSLMGSGTPAQAGRVAIGGESAPAAAVTPRAEPIAQAAPVVDERIPARERLKLGVDDAPLEEDTQARAPLAPAEPGLEVRGRVVDESGEPWTEFTLLAQAWGPKPAADVADHVRTEFRDANGAFTLKGLYPSRWTLVAESGISRSASVRFDLPGDSGPLRVVITRPGRVVGQVVDEAGIGVPGAEVRLEALGRGLAAPTRALALAVEGGEFAFTGVPPGRLRLSATGPGYADSATTSLELHPGVTSEPVRIVLRPPGRITGRLHESLQRAGAGTATLRDAEYGRELETLALDDEGRFAFSGLKPGSYDVFVNLESAVPYGARPFVSKIWRSTRVELTSGAEPHVVVGEPSNLAIHVVGSVLRGRRKPASGVAVTFSSTSWATRTRSGKDGRYEVWLEEPGEYRVVTGEERRVEHAVDIPQRPTFVQNLELPDAVLSGVVRGRDGRARVGESVFLLQEVGPKGEFGSWARQPRSTTTDAKGRFMFDELEAGTYLVQAGGEGRLDSESCLDPGMWKPGALMEKRPSTELGSSGPITLRPNERKSKVEVRMLLRAKLHGRVVDGAGEPLVGAGVMGIGSPLGRGFAATLTSADGEFELADLAPGTWRVWASGGSREGEPRELTLEPGETLELDLTLER